MTLSSGLTLRSRRRTRGIWRCASREAERLERVEKRRQEEAAEKERHEEQQRRLAAERREERERKLERARHAKATLEDNPDALRKGKWPRCTQ